MGVSSMDLECHLIMSNVYINLFWHPGWDPVFIISISITIQQDKQPASRTSLTSFSQANLNNSHQPNNLNFQAPTPTFAMAATTFFTTSALVNYGRSGYNK